MCDHVVSVGSESTEPWQKKKIRYLVILPESVKLDLSDHMTFSQSNLFAPEQSEAFFLVTLLVKCFCLS